MASKYGMQEDRHFEYLKLKLYVPNSQDIHSSKSFVAVVKQLEFITATNVAQYVTMCFRPFHLGAGLQKQLYFTSPMQW